MSTAPGTWVAAVDLGASSVRVCTCNIEDEPLEYDVVHRVRHQPHYASDGVLRWDWTTIRKAVVDGLEQARESHKLASIGIDTWAVDYGLLDTNGHLLVEPACYRDTRTNNYKDLIRQIGVERLYSINGLQPLPFNTIFQLDIEDANLLAQTRHILTLPELVAHHLTGVAAAETTSAGSTGLVDQVTRTWSVELLDHINLSPHLLPLISEPGTALGIWHGIPVHLVAGHDTACAVVAIDASEPNPCFVSTGTWILPGQELNHPVLTRGARTSQFTNEYGPQATTRFLKNIAGFWILEECRKNWRGASTAELLARAESASTPEICFDATDARFLSPQDMEAEVLDASGLPPTTSPSVTVSVIVNSLAATTSAVLAQSAKLSDVSIERIHVIGGGSRSTQFIEQLSERMQTPVTVGATESAALGNAIIQGIALGRWDSVDSARRSLSA